MKRFVVKSSSTIALLALATLPLLACGDDGGPAATPDAGGDGPIMGAYSHYTNDTISVPQSSAQTRDFGLNIDGDDANRPDNALGGILSALKQQNVDIQKAVTDSVVAGRLVLLHSVQATSLSAAAAAGWKVLLGAPTATPPKYDGTDVMMVDGTSPTDGILKGSIAGGHFEGGPGNVTIALSLTTGTPIRVKLVGARIKGDLTADGCTSGVLGGAITNDELNSSVIPGIQTLMNNSIKDDGPDGMHPMACAAAGDVCPAAMNGDATSCDVERHICRSDTSKTILNIFDTNKDAQITIDEIKNNTLIKALLAPDVDLFNGTTFDPRKDGVKDSLSVGIGFTCKKATFSVSNETP